MLREHLLHVVQVRLQQKELLTELVYILRPVLFGHTELPVPWDATAVLHSASASKPHPGWIGC